MVIRRFDVFLCELDPTVGSEMQKARPCIVVSPNELNASIRTIIVVPMTSRIRPYPYRVPCRFQGRVGEVALDQIRTVDRQRLLRKLGRISPTTADAILGKLQELFAP